MLSVGIPQPQSSVQRNTYSILDDIPGLHREFQLLQRLIYARREHDMQTILQLHRMLEQMQHASVSYEYNMNTRLQQLQSSNEQLQCNLACNDCITILSYQYIQELQSDIQKLQHDSASSDRVKDTEIQQLQCSVQNLQEDLDSKTCFVEQLLQERHYGLADEAQLTEIRADNARLNTQNAALAASLRECRHHATQQQTVLR